MYLNLYDFLETLYEKIFRVHCMCAQSCLTLCDPRVCSPPGYSVHGILQARLEWVAIAFSNA